VQNWSLFSSILLTCKSFWQISFSRYTFFKIFPRIWNQRKIPHNQMENFFDKHLKEYYLASFCRWIPSSCENHCNLLDTCSNSSNSNSNSRFVYGIEKGLIPSLFLYTSDLEYSCLVSSLTSTPLNVSIGADDVGRTAR
jgi:hypothetical protein